MVRLWIALLLVMVLGLAAPLGAAEKKEHDDSKKAHGDGHGHHLGKPATPDATNILSFSEDLAIFTFIVFVIVLIILWLFAWGPISRALDERERRISDHIAAAQRQNEEARRMLVQYEKKLESAQGEVRAILEEARRDAAHTQDEILAKAREDAQRERDRAVREIDQARQTALKELGEKSVDLAVELAGKIVASKLSPDDHARMVQDAVTRFAKAEPSRN
jgi:F-type H+-transporting ATPase subunit b